jgi:hypothetical protein
MFSVLNKDDKIELCMNETSYSLSIREATALKYALYGAIGVGIANNHKKS